MSQTLRKTGAALCALCVALLAACGPSESLYVYESPPEGIPETPYWHPIGDSLFWYRAADSQAVLQLSPESAPGVRSQTLFEVRELGWRMAVNRSAGLSRSSDAQELSQALYAVEKVDRATTPLTHYDTYRKAFWSGTDTTLVGLLPGLQFRGEGPAQYFWPSTLIVVWKPGMREVEARAFIDSLGFRVLTPLALAQNYWVERAWAVDLPAGLELFTWLRFFNRDGRVHVAVPVQSSREPPTPDHRILRRFPPQPDSLLLPGVEKFSSVLRTAWEIATFSGHTDFVEDNTGLVVSDGRLRVRVRSEGGSRVADAVASLGGEVILSDSDGTEAWLPYEQLPALGSRPEVASIIEVRTNLLGG